jgi:hypothetical protein
MKIYSAKDLIVYQKHSERRWRYLMNRNSSQPKSGMP